MEAHRVSLMVRAQHYPCFCVLLPVAGGEFRTLGALNGNVQVEAAVRLLTHCADEMDTHRAEIVARDEQHAEDRSLREQQDREYEEALAMDRQREELTRVKEREEETIRRK